MRAVRKTCLAFAAGLAFLFASVANVHAHVHLCLDGQEPPAAMHLHEAGHLDHHSEHDDTPDAAEVHDDVDVDVPAEMLAKTLKLELPAMAPTGSPGFQLDAAPPAAVIADSGTFFHPSPPPYWRPPLRGPPR